MPSSRVRHIILKQVYDDFKEIGFTYAPDYEEYFGKSKKPVLFRVVKKQFNTWVRLLASLKRYYPDVYKKPVKQPEPAIKKVSIPKVSAPKPMQAKPKAVEKDDGKDI